jgi:hypothetical protein
VLKSGCTIEKLKERNMEKTTMLIIRYKVIAVFIMDLRYRAQFNPDLPCTLLFEEDEWKLQYCAANKTKRAPEKAYTIKQVVDYVSWLGGPKRASSDGLPGVKTVWTGLQNFIRSWTIVNCSILWVKFSKVTCGFSSRRKRPARAGFSSSGSAMRRGIWSRCGLRGTGCMTIRKGPIWPKEPLPNYSDGYGMVENIV